MSDELSKRRKAVWLTVALAAAFVFGIVVLAGGDWLPGTVIVVASGAGLIQQFAVLRRPHAG